MSYITTAPCLSLKGELSLPGDKSISHRFVMFSSIAQGTSCARNILLGEDCLSTINAFRALGVHIMYDDVSCVVEGVGKHGLQKANQSLFLGNSGTTMRLMIGLLAVQKFDSVLTGDIS